MDKILDEHCRAAGVSATQVGPMLSAPEIAELKDFAERMPYISQIRKEFTDAARQAERRTREKEAAEVARGPQSGRSVYTATRLKVELYTQTTAVTQRSERETISRDR